MMRLRADGADRLGGGGSWADDYGTGEYDIHYQECERGES